MDVSKIRAITLSDEFREYTDALCEYASNFVPEIREQFAEKAFEMYQNESVRKLVLAYGKDAEERRKNRKKYFQWACESAATGESCKYSIDLMNSALAKNYGDAIWLLFGAELVD